jgi:hopanoid biosynthesis associated protein HpnK
VRNLIITADDFGADIAVNDAVETAHRQGVLTAASLMVSAPAASDAVARARNLPSLRVGLHLVLVEGRPTLPAEQVSLLVDGEGRFRTDMAAAGAAMFFDPAARRQLAAEIAAQFAAFAATGLALDHVNAHKHFHLHPTIAGLILKIGARHGLRAARAPVERADVLRAVEPGSVPPGLDPLNLMARQLQRRFRRAGLTVPDQVFGLRWSGAMTTSRLRGLIEALPDGLTEIYLHPAAAHAFPGSAQGYGYVEELTALIAPEVVTAAAKPNIRRGGFSDFAP